MDRLAEEASGLRHLRWAREVLATIESHFEHNPRLSQAEREALLEENVKLRALIVALSTAVKAYRDFLERERVRFRGMQRVARFLGATAKDADERAEAAAIQEGVDEATKGMELRERAPRRKAVREGVESLRRGLAAMDARLARATSVELVESLYPELARGGAIVADDGDGDDDGAATDLDWKSL